MPRALCVTLNLKLLYPHMATVCLILDTRRTVLLYWVPPTLGLLAVCLLTVLASAA